uniref:Protein kinase domain-containing protein n=1 Tax=Calcidiscus leptoporus TaxID=127549 RepID=A0A6U5G9F0_9EUKA|mmetsp:Transcript_29107/g.68103  ORF Transcript_29107/g.68103 Transcript_29107/m.68103 type:complete len:431 (+) Transcript_29107:94-1386(+)
MKRIFPTKKAAAASAASAPEKATFLVRPGSSRKSRSLGASPTRRCDQPELKSLSSRGGAGSRSMGTADDTGFVVSSGMSKTCREDAEEGVSCADAMSRSFSPTPKRLGRHEPMPEMGGAYGKHVLTLREASLGERVFLGQGEFCTAERTHVGDRMLAVKRLRRERAKDQAACRDLEREIHLMSSMDHPNILKVAATGVLDNGQPFMCVELLSSVLSRSLPKTIEEVPIWTRQRVIKKWPLTRAVSVGLGLANALHYCHNLFSSRYRVLHRDLKPANIGFMSDGRVVLFDFGVCSFWDKEKDFEEPDAPRPLTGLTGSLRYMAPEVALEQPYNHKSEVFSFATVLWEMASHVRPFEWMDSDMFMEYACRQGVRCKLGKSWPTEFKELINACWSIDMNDRPDAEEIVLKLKAIQGDLYTSKGQLQRSSATVM